LLAQSRGGMRRRSYGGGGSGGGDGCEGDSDRHTLVNALSRLHYTVAEALGTT
jgi:hypothetical protein